MVSNQNCEIEFNELFYADFHTNEPMLNDLRTRLHKQNFQLFTTRTDFYAYHHHAQGQNGENKPYNLCRSVPREPAEWVGTPCDIVTNIVHENDVNLFQLLVSWGMNVRKYNRDGWTILSVALHHPGPIADYVFTNIITPADITTPVMVSEHSMNLASYLALGDETLFQKLLTLDTPGVMAALDAKATHHLIREYPASDISLFLTSGLPINAVDDESKDTSVHAAVSRVANALEMVDVVCNAIDPALLNTTNFFAETALWQAYRWDTLAFKFLLRQGMDPDVLDLRGLTLLHQACWDMRPEMVKALLEHGANPNAGVGSLHGTPMHYLMDSAFDKEFPQDYRAVTVEIISILEDKGGNVHAQNSQGETVAGVMGRRGAAVMGDIHGIMPIRGQK
ncbi:hypothetical protein FE257_013071 [Aspergillus nanangensis]|uniref:Ankyrin n=1 Tax=Aspergillus nanangensis TaxID=2582783 RepID=A0AAD4CGB3_ASPNN|nr:hypothetical protein FE257_013071 [Aspergillus nanangensis]